MSARADAERFADLFPEIYRRFVARRTHDRNRLTPQMWAILQHLELAGPLTVGEAARHFERAQSVVSDTVSALEARGLLERIRDARDRRRTLVWLTEDAQEHLRRERRVLDEERLAAAMEALSPRARTQLLEGMRALVDSPATSSRKEKTR